MKCPSCNAEMASLEHRGVEIDRCTKCAGLWFDAFEHEQLKELRGSGEIDAAPGAKAAARSGPAACPRCEQAMIPWWSPGTTHRL